MSKAPASARMMRSWWKRRCTGSAHSQNPSRTASAMPSPSRRRGPKGASARPNWRASTVSKAALPCRSRPARAASHSKPGRASLPSVSWSFGSGQISSGASRVRCTGERQGVGNQKVYHSDFRRLLHYRMALPYELLIGLRYTRAKRRNHFISFISLISMLGIGLGVAALIVVVSVINVFQKELRTRILGVASHIPIVGVSGELNQWELVAEQAMKHPEVRASAPFVQSQGMFSVDGNVKGALVRGILPDCYDTVADFRKTIQSGSLDDLKPGSFGIVLGADLAR